MMCSPTRTKLNWIVGTSYCSIGAVVISQNVELKTPHGICWSIERFTLSFTLCSRCLCSRSQHAYQLRFCFAFYFFFIFILNLCYHRFAFSSFIQQLYKETKKNHSYTDNRYGKSVERCATKHINERWNATNIEDHNTVANFRMSDWKRQIFSQPCVRLVCHLGINVCVFSSFI